MLDKIFKVLIVLLCGISALMVTDQITPILVELLEGSFPGIGLFKTTIITIIIFVLGGIIGVLIGYGAAPMISRGIWGAIRWMEGALSKFSGQDLLLGTIGLFLGLIIANLIGVAFIHLPIVGAYLPVIFSVVLGYVGMSMAVHKKAEILTIIANLKSKAVKDKDKDGSRRKKGQEGKLLDTSVIIDGRIAEICKTGFLEGPLFVPVFVLEELQHIADSADLLKRNKGRRGLDILSAMQKEEDMNVVVIHDDFEDITEVDSKLIRLGAAKGYKIITNDYNLNKVAILQGITVLNINDLANAVKPARIPGEEMNVLVVKAGKENNQGIAYLEDGTMIVVEDGQQYIGANVAIVVTSVLQTSAGRMIFAKPNEG